MFGHPRLQQCNIYPFMLLGRGEDFKDGIPRQDAHDCGDLSMALAFSGPKFMQTKHKGDT